MYLQVERLSKLIETPVSNMVDTKRFEVINSTANVDKRLVKLFELIENDFLAKIMHSTQSIAPYKASGFVICCAAALIDRVQLLSLTSELACKNRYNMPTFVRTF